MPNLTWGRAAIIGAPPVAVGWLTGWLTGASTTPVVAAVVPLVFGLFSAIGFGLFARVLRGPEDRPSDEKPDRDLSCEHVPAIAATSVVVFCIAFWLGMHSGIGHRLPEYPPLNFSQSQLKDLQPSEVAAIHRLQMDLRENGIGPERFGRILNDTILPVIKNHPLDEKSGDETPEELIAHYRKVEQRRTEFNRVLDHIYGTKEFRGYGGGVPVSQPVIGHQVSVQMAPGEI